MLNQRLVGGILPLLPLLVGIGMATGQSYPAKPVRIITTSPGSGNDFMARQIGPGISGALGQPVIIENRATGFLAAEAVSKTPPDGYTLTIQGAIFWTVPLLREVPYDVLRDFAPISLISRQASIVAVHPSLPVRSINDLIALAKDRPGQLNYASSGTGGNSHLAAELLKSMAGVNLVHVPYKGQSPAITSVISGEAQAVITDLGLLMPYVKTGKLRALAVTSAERSALTPELPTVAAAGLPGYEMVGVTGMFAPARTPGVVITRLNQELTRFLNQPQVKEQLLSSGEEVVASSPEQFEAAIRGHIARVGKVIKEVGIKAD